MSHLPDPRWVDRLPDCPACGYSLIELAAPVACPECGAASVGRVLIVYGVPARITSGSKSRRRLTIASVALAIAMTHLWALGIFFIGWRATAVAVLGCIGAVVAVVMTGKSADGGKCRMILCRAGVASQPLLKKGELGPSGFVPWVGDERFTLTQVGPFWMKLRAVSVSTDAVAIDAGVRFPARDAVGLEAALRELAGQGNQTERRDEVAGETAAIGS